MRFASLLYNCPMMAAQRNMRIYSPDGKRLNSMQRGLNIIVFDDGTVHKFLMK